MKLRNSILLILGALGSGCSQSPGRPPPLVADASDIGDDHAQDVPASRDTSPDTAPDVTHDAPADTASDVVTDAGTAPDADGAVRPDVALDVPADVLPDVANVMDVALDVGGDAGAWRPIPGGMCNARERNVATQDSPHVDPDAGPVLYLTNPPASGPHFNEWARWGAHRNVARGNWVHNLEHGGVVFLYRCPTGTCDATVSSLVSAMNSIPMDPTCMPDDASPARVRVVITNDNAIETPVAAAAWGWLYAADCVDAPSLRDFYGRHAGMAPEDFCFDGTVP